MNLKELFDIQAELDKAILAKHPVQDGEDRFKKLIVAFTVELAEMMNEYRSFKFWSKDQEPRTEVYTLKKEYQHLHITQTSMWEYQLRDKFGKIVFDDVTDDHHDYKNPLLEEYVDGLHFVLSIGNYIELTEDLIHPVAKQKDVEDAYLDILEIALKIDMNRHWYDTLFTRFIELGEMLGFTESDIKNAYLAKNKINHERQANGY